MLRNPFRNLDHKKLSRSSEALKSQNDYYKIVNRRIFAFGIIIVVIFCIVITRLLYLQVREQENYAVKLENYSSQKQKDSTARGEIVDRNGKVVAKTVSSHNIVYFPPKDVTSKEQWELAQVFAKDFNVSHDNMTNSDYQDLYMFLHTDASGKKDNGENLLTDAEKETVVDATKREELVRSRITKEMVDELADDDTKNAFVVYLAMRKLPNNQNKVIIEDVDSNSVAKLMENKDKYRGFDVNLGSWKRDYPYKGTLRDVLGTVTTSTQGVPSEERETYEALGYSLTERVGNSGLEKQYESLLRGTPKVSEISYDTDGTAIMNQISSGKNGYDLHLSIDIDLQQKVDEIVEDTVEKYAGAKGRAKFKKAIVVLMNPQTGEVYTMSGKYKDDKGKIQNYSSGVYLDAFASGSVVKGATVYTMLEEGIQTRYSVENDAPIKIAGTKSKGSFSNYGPVNAITALENSSNVYMWLSVIKLAGGTYKYDAPMGVDLESYNATIKKLRNYYSMFGLGTLTGLDVPNEALGFVGYSDVIGTMLDFVIGQYDNYTPIQLAQYVSTIANGGKKVQPKLLNTATEVNSDNVVFDNKTKVLSALTGSKENLETVRMGFRQVVEGGHASAALKGMKVQVAAKTGTAENGDYTNASLIGFAPYDSEAKVAFACSVPESAENNVGVEANLCATEIMPKVLEEFFKKY